MKILWQDIFTIKIPFTEKSDLLWDALAKLSRQIKSDGTQIDFAWLKRSSGLN
jgi:hypothetical protein